MNISLDAGALCIKSHQFGNATFTKNLIEGFSQYDKKNTYTAYTFCNIKSPAKNVTCKKLPKSLFMKGGITFAEATSSHDIFLALNQALPIFTKSRVFSFSHGVSFLRYPELYPDSDRLKKQLGTMVKRSEKIFVSSQRVRQEILSVYANAKVIVLPFGVPFDMMENRQRQVEDYFLYVGMNIPVKNITFLKEAFTTFRSKKGFEHYKLYLVGNFHESTTLKNIISIPMVSRTKLKTLYANATAYLSASHYESFNFPVIEALSQNCPVIGTSSAIIPELEKYVTVTQGKSQFIEAMKTLTVKKISIQKADTIRREFSWQSYVKKLTNYYA